MPVDLGFVGWFGGFQDRRYSGQRFDDGADLLGGHDAAAGELAQLSFRDSPLRLDLGDPLLNDGGVGPDLQRSAVAVELGLAGGDLLAGGDDPVLVGVAVLGVCHGLQRAVQVGGGERPVDPRVDQFDDLVLAYVQAAGVGEAVGIGVLGGVGAPVVVATVVKAADHSPAAQAAEEHAREGVAALACARLVLDVRSAGSGGEPDLDVLERVVVHERLMGSSGGVNPFLGGVPAHLGFVAEGDIVDVDEDLGLALLVPHLPAGVPGVGEDDPYGALGPGAGGPVRVADRIGSRWGQNAVAGETLGDGEDPGPGEEFGVDAPHHRCGERVGFQPVQALAVGGLAGVGVRSGVGESVSVRWAAAEVSALHR